MELELNPNISDVIDEVTNAIINVFCGEQLVLTPCQLLAGRMVIDAVEGYLELHKNSPIAVWANTEVT